MLTTDPAGTARDALRTRFPDAIVIEGDGGWDAARMAFNVLFDQQPVAVARPGSAAEAAEIVGAAADLDLRVTAQGSAHTRCRSARSRERSWYGSIG